MLTWGGGWTVSEYSLYTITMVGFSEDLAKANLPIVNAIYKVTSPHHLPVLIQINEAAYLGHGKSLLSKMKTGFHNLKLTMILCLEQAV